MNWWDCRRAGEANACRHDGLVEIVVAILLASRIAFIFGTDEGILLALEDVDAAAVMV